MTDAISCRKCHGNGEDHVIIEKNVKCDFVSAHVTPEAKGSKVTTSTSVIAHSRLVCCSCNAVWP